MSETGYPHYRQKPAGGRSTCKGPAGSSAASSPRTAVGRDGGKGNLSGRATTPRSPLADRSRGFIDERIPPVASRPTASRGEGEGGGRHLVLGVRRGTRDAPYPARARSHTPNPALPLRSALKSNSPPAIPLTALFCPSPIAPAPTPHRARATAQDGRGAAP